MRLALTRHEIKQQHRWSQLKKTPIPVVSKFSDSHYGTKTEEVNRKPEEKHDNRTS